MEGEENVYVHVHVVVTLCPIFLCIVIMQVSENTEC
jgi:hypothetical protein